MEPIVQEPIPKPSSAIQEIVRHQVVGVHGADGHHVLPLVEGVSSFGPESACPVAGLEPVMN